MGNYGCLGGDGATLAGMCARYTLTRTELGGVVEALGADVDPSAAAIRLPRFNVGPSQICVIARAGRGGDEGNDGAARPVPTAATWGLRLGNQLVVNVRSEAAGTRRPGLQRCVVPTDGFYEWTGEKGHKRAIWFHRPGGELVLLAGLAGEGDEVGALPRFAVLTAVARSPVKEVHDRMPVVLTGARARAWLSRGGRVEGEAVELVGREVSARVNLVANDDAELLADAEARGAARQMRLL